MPAAITARRTTAASIMAAAMAMAAAITADTAPAFMEEASIAAASIAAPAIIAAAMAMAAIAAATAAVITAASGGARPIGNAVDRRDGVLRQLRWGRRHIGRTERTPVLPAELLAPDGGGAADGAPR